MIHGFGVGNHAEGRPVFGCVNEVKRVPCSMLQRAVVAKADMRRKEKRGEVS